MGSGSDFIQTPVFIVIFLFLFVSLFLFTHKKGKNISNKLLGSLFLCYGLWVFDLYAAFYLYMDYPYMAYIFNNFLWLLGPCLLLYTQSVIYKNFRFKKIHFLHTVPFILAVLISIFTFHIQPMDYKRTYLEHALADQSILIWGSSAVILAYVLTYIIVAFRTILRYQDVLTNMVSNAEKIRLSWLKFMLIGSFVIFFSLITVVLNQYFRWEKSMPVGLMYLYIFLLFIFITTTLFKSLKQPEIFSGISTDEVQTVSKYPASSLTEEDSNKIKDKMTHFMESDKPYLDPDLSLKNLAQKLDLNARDLSQVINNNIGLRFFDFVNRYRIQDAASLIDNPPDPKITILEIMYDVGFNSKSSFNSAFRKFTGTTPSEFKNKSRNIRRAT